MICSQIICIIYPWECIFLFYLKMHNWRIISACMIFDFPFFFNEIKFDRHKSEMRAKLTCMLMLLNVIIIVNVIRSLASVVKKHLQMTQMRKRKFQEHQRSQLCSHSRLVSKCNELKPFYNKYFQSHLKSVFKVYHFNNINFRGI